MGSYALQYLWSSDGSGLDRSGCRRVGKKDRAA